jgi:hemerythrin superfamily protein
MFIAQDGSGNPSRRYGSLMVGAAGGMLLGRLLPTLIANASGIIRGAAGKDPFGGLVRQHRTLLSLLTQMENVPRESRAKRMSLFLLFKRTLAKHALAEEDIIYPLLQDDAKRVEEAEKLYREHARMKVLLFELERSVNDDETWPARVRDLRNEIEPHARQEEEVEFPKLRGLMDKKGNIELARKIHQEESLIV